VGLFLQHAVPCFGRNAFLVTIVLINMQPTQRTKIVRQKNTQKQEDDFPWFEVSLVGGFFIVFILPVLILASIFLLFQAFDLIYPGVYIGETSVWGLTREKAVSKVDELWNEEHLLVITDGQRDWSAPPADFGLWVSSESAVEEAYWIGRGSDALYEYLELLTGKTHTFQSQVIFYPEIALTELERWAGVINITGYPTGVRYQEGEWVIVPGQDGLALDVNATIADLSADPDAVINNGVLLFSMFREGFNLGDTQVSIENILPQLEQPLRISAYDPITDIEENWQVTPNDLASMIHIVYDGQPHPHIDMLSFIAYLNDYLSSTHAKWTVEPDADLADLDAVWQADSVYSITVWHKSFDYIVQPGDSLNGLGLEYGMPYWHIMDANPFLYDTGLHAGQIIRIPSKNELLPLPVIRNKRIEISINQQRMRTYLNSSLQDEYIISTGVASSPTHTGVFQVQTHELNAYASVWDLYMPHFLGIYEGWPGFMNGIHGLPTLSSGNILWADVLGSPASYGCIILALDDAEDLYYWAEDGVVVEIIQ